MSLHTIRAFKIGDQRYRHAICTSTDTVFLERYQDNPDATCESDLWDSLLCYDHNAVARTPDMKKVGDFRCEGAPNQWVFHEGPNRTRITFPPTEGCRVSAGHGSPLLPDVAADRSKPRSGSDTTADVTIAFCSPCLVRNQASQAHPGAVKSTCVGFFLDCAISAP